MLAPNEQSYPSGGVQVTGKPTERNVQLGFALRRARKEATRKVTQLAAGQELGFSQPTIARIESGYRELSPGELATLMRLYDPPQDIRDEIHRLTTLPDTAESGDLSPNQHFARMLEEMKYATEIFSFHSDRIPMALQTDQYALTQYELVNKSITPAAVLRAREDRVRRIFTRPDPPRYRAILTESSFDWPPGGIAAIIKQQALHLLELTEANPRFSLHVLRKGARVNYVHTDFTVLRMPGGKRDMVYGPLGEDGRLLTEKLKIDEHLRYWYGAEKAALGEDDSKKFLNELAR